MASRPPIQLLVRSAFLRGKQAVLEEAAAKLDRIVTALTADSEARVQNQLDALSRELDAERQRLEQDRQHMRRSLDAAWEQVFTLQAWGELCRDPLQPLH
jgi:outer membrane murein-binding lipoprotein Lpp